MISLFQLLPSNTSIWKLPKICPVSELSQPWSVNVAVKTIILFTIPLMFAMSLSVPSVRHSSTVAKSVLLALGEFSRLSNFFTPFSHTLFTLTVRLVMTFDLQSIFSSLKMGLHQIWTFINPLSINNGWSFWFFNFLVSCNWRKFIWPHFKLYWCCQGWSILHYFGWWKLWQVKR